MYTVVKTFTRPNADVPFFRAQLPYIQDLIFELGITNQATLSEDQLTQTITLVAPSRAVFRQLVEDAIFENNFKAPQDEYNTAHGIETEVTTSGA